ncbi:unnamed protein product [Soboliphyme baturini]|uniref:S9 family peptidase n=1 Tax=Soboliphyme baturini TaxID=241478 RepID=A0A183IBV1_9BILA|nr:unnamed protein product [Soboliphyme baturini]
MVRISGDSEWISYLAPANNVMNIFAKRLRNGVHYQLTNETHRGITKYSWSHDNRTILYSRDHNGDENWSLHAVNVETGEDRTLTDTSGVKADILALSPQIPDFIIIGLNNRDSRFSDAYRVDLRNGEKTLILENDLYSDLYFDMQLELRLVENETGEASNLYFLMEPVDGVLVAKLHKTLSPDDALYTSPLKFSVDGKRLFWLDNKGRDMAALIEENLDTGQQRILHSPRRADTSKVISHPTTGEPVIVFEEYAVPDGYVVMSSVSDDFQRLRNYFPQGSVIDIPSTSLDFRKWIVAISSDAEPISYYLYDLDDPNRTFSLLFHTMEKVMQYDTASTRVIELLANRGYATLQCNYRGSAGYGKKYLAAGNGEWGRKMQYDLLDAVEWAVKKNFTHPLKVAILGGSYGGYATLAGLAFTPNAFACGIDIVGPSNLITLINSRISKPLLIAQGANDPRVKKHESDQIVDVLKSNDVPVTYLLFPDEGHGFVRPENRLAFYVFVEAFLQRCLGGESQPAESDLEGSSVEVKVQNMAGDYSRLSSQRTKSGKVSCKSVGDLVPMGRGYCSVEQMTTKPGFVLQSGRVANARKAGAKECGSFVILLAMRPFSDAD